MVSCQRLLSAAPTSRLDRRTVLHHDDGIKIDYLLLGDTGIGGGAIDGTEWCSTWFNTAIALEVAQRDRVAAIENRIMANESHPVAVVVLKDVVELMNHPAIDRADIHGDPMVAGSPEDRPARLRIGFITAGIGGWGMAEQRPGVARRGRGRRTRPCRRPLARTPGTGRLRRARPPPGPRAAVPRRCCLPALVDPPSLADRILAVNGCSYNRYRKTDRLLARGGCSST